MKSSSIIAIAIAVAVLIAGAVYFLDVDQTQEARLPDVDVSVEGGQAPEYDVQTGSVDVTSEKKTVEVTVPKVDVEPAPED